LNLLFVPLRVGAVVGQGSDSAKPHCSFNGMLTFSADRVDLELWGLIPSGNLLGQIISQIIASDVG